MPFYTTAGFWNCYSWNNSKTVWTVTFLNAIFDTEYDILWYLNIQQEFECRSTCATDCTMYICLIASTMAGRVHNSLLLCRLPHVIPNNDQIKACTWVTIITISFNTIYIVLNSSLCCSWVIHFPKNNK